MAIRFDENDIRVMGRNAAGVRGINLKGDDEVVGVVLATDDEDLLTVTQNGFGKRTALKEYLKQADDGTTRAQSRGGKGRIDIRTTERNGRVVTIRCVSDSDSVMFISKNGMIVRVPVSSISRIGRNTKGVKLVNLKAGDRLISAARVAETEEEVNSQAEQPNN